MGVSRQLPLVDLDRNPSCWNERMVPGEYAVHYSHFDAQASGVPFCTVFPSREEAQTHANEHVKLRPYLRCRVYDHRGFIGPPLLEIRGVEHKEHGEITPKLRRWLGSVLFVAGLMLVVIDWVHDFGLLWPAMIGTRLLIPALCCWL
jgi:hypothetical protein